MTHRPNPLAALALVLAAALAVSPAHAEPAPAGGTARLQAADPGQPASKETVDELCNRPNLVANPSFEQGDADNTSPAHWSPIDGLVWRWTSDPDAPGRGKVLLIDTDVYQRQAYPWWIDHYVNGKPLSEAPAKTPTTGPRWDTVGGLDGGFFLSDFIPVKPGGAYKVVLDVKGPGMKVFVKGYEKILPISFADENPAVQELFRKARNEPLLDKNNRPIKYRPRYQYSFWFAAGGGPEWATYTHNLPFNPNNREITEKVRFVRVMLYPYWPAAQYMIDNVRVVEVDPLPDRGRPKAEEADIQEGKVMRGSKN